MFDTNAFQQDPLVVLLNESNIVKRPTGSVETPVGFVMVNHSRNNNARIQIKPKSVRPEVIDIDNQNPNTFLDEYRGELNTCLTHSSKFIISCAGAPNNFSFATSFGQMIVDLYRNNPNIQIILNGNVYTPATFIKTVNSRTLFDSEFMSTGLSRAA